MIDERLKKYFTIVSVYHRQDNDGRYKMLAGFLRTSSLVESDPFTRHLVGKFQYKESNKYAPSNSNPEPPRRA